ncbi:MAG: hypothetical protein K9H48_07985 [Melioribacteraceae bacterium]|nr:hypothetical protein [Melioribacteraceae bacterium]
MLKKMYMLILVCMIGLFLIGCRQEVSTEVDYKDIKNAVESEKGSFNAPMELVFEVADMDSFKQEEEYVQFLLSKAFPQGVSDFEYFTKDSTTYVKVKIEIPVYVNNTDVWTDGKNTLFSLTYFDDILFLDMNKEKYEDFKAGWDNHFIFQSGIDITEMLLYVFIANTTNESPEVRVMPNFIDGKARVYPEEQELESKEYLTILMSDLSLYYLKDKGQVELLSFE